MSSLPSPDNSISVYACLLIPYNPLPMSLLSVPVPLRVGLLSVSIPVPLSVKSFHCVSLLPSPRMSSFRGYLILCLCPLRGALRPRIRPYLRLRPELSFKVAGTFIYTSIIPSSPLPAMRSPAPMRSSRTNHDAIFLITTCSAHVQCGCQLGYTPPGIPYSHGLVPTTCNAIFRSLLDRYYRSITMSYSL